MTGIPILAQPALTDFISVSTKIAIIADDLSGAADCGIACAITGRDVIVALDHSLLPPHTGILCVDLDTRRLPPCEAARRVSAFVAGHFAPDTIIFKKIDSTLRGHIAAELTALLDEPVARKKPVAIFAAAYPALGREVRQGRHFVYKDALEDSEIWKNENRQGVASVTALLRESGLRVAVIPLDEVRGTLEQKLRDAAQAYDVLACDAECDADLDRIARAANRLSATTDAGVIWVGSAGLAHALGRLLADNAKMMPPTCPPRYGAPLLFVVGSMSSMSKRQVDTLVAGGQVLRVNVSTVALQSHALSPVTRQMDDAIARKQHVALVLETDDAADLTQGGFFAEALGQLTAPYARLIGGLIVTGGETARAVLAGFGITNLRLVAEVQPGVPLALSHDAQCLPVITKAGAFGDENTFLNCYTALGGKVKFSNKENNL